MFPLHQGTLLRHWMTYSHVWPLSSHGCRRINWIWIQMKLNYTLSGRNDGGADTSLYGFGVKTNPAKSARNLGDYLTKLSPSAHIYQQCVAYAFTLCAVCGIFAIILIWMVQNKIQQLWFPVVDTDLTKLQHIQDRLARLGRKSPPFVGSVPLVRSLHWLPVRFRILFKISLLTYKTLHEKQPVYLHACPITPIPCTEIKVLVRRSLSQVA